MTANPAPRKWISSDEYRQIAGGIVKQWSAKHTASRHMSLFALDDLAYQIALAMAREQELNANRTYPSEPGKG